MKRTIAYIITIFISLHAKSQLDILASSKGNSFPLHQSTIVYDESEPKLIKITAQLLQQDIKLVTKTNVDIHTKQIQSPTIYIGTTQSKHIQDLLKKNIIQPASLPTEWDGYSIQLTHPNDSTIPQSLVIIGTNKRGAAYGTLLLSEKMGVSPWYWWADVPVVHKEALYVAIKDIYKDAPQVKYRGIFINDEAPALSSWSKEKFGGFNHHFYTKVFELILRNKGNFLWPAMWGSAFYDDDLRNQEVADDWGIVIGTSHHEPLMRAHDEWRRYGQGAWNYSTNDSTLQSFWKSSLHRAKNEKIITLGMRGDGDEPMSTETATELLEKIVADQRRLIEEVTQLPAEKSPQVWALYKEVQDYYDKGMRVPDDVTLLLCDDNWGNVRRLPKLTDAPRKGGYGMYYHFDYVGGPRNYKWVNTNPLPRVWEQMNLTWEHGVKELWIVNVGDIKPMELPISFFLHQAWNPNRLTIDSVKPYTIQWAKQQFGEKYAEDIARLITGYTQINGRRKPELLDHRSYALHHYQEFTKVVQDYNLLSQKAQSIQSELPPQYQDAYFQLVLHPIVAGANLHEMYYQVALNHYYYEQNDIKANIAADKVKELYINDSLITIEYHRLKKGKWNHMMSQTHIGYTYWQQPDKQVMPNVKYLSQGTDHIPAIHYKTDNTPRNAKKNSYIEKDGYVSIDVTKFTKKKESKVIQWKVMPDLGRTGDAITSFPYTESVESLTKKSPYLAYEIETESAGNVTLTAFFSPTLNIYHTPTGLRYAIQIDNEKPQIIGINAADNDHRIWDQWMIQNIITISTQHHLKKPGKHIIRYWLIDNGVILQKLLLNTGGLKESLLGPPPTRK